MVSVKYALLAFGLLGAAANAAPAPEVDYVSALIPGEGLPSPKELGMTNADLTKPIPEDDLPLDGRHSLPAGISERDLSILEKRTTCRFTDTCKLRDSTACFNYLHRLNTRACTVTRRPGQFCRMGGCSWIGQAAGTNRASSHCRDVARGGKKVNDRCRIFDRIGGFNFAHGNGHVRVTIAGRS
ncbi:hypothetical protein H072_1890 [Dactylellina haptotyla CBS 200.50]|uniref:Cyanovirin-N domain-containing protein n=1 Tax=Dactylellina haptotyla (strain CBS 200.50) TaxID=1284197 RepID=S8BXA3_DACHA|nr:hypothetical protein H072_1890 [Dactylellina haptotyla CBS 200.50]